MLKERRDHTHWATHFYWVFVPNKPRQSSLTTVISSHQAPCLSREGPGWMTSMCDGWMMAIYREKLASVLFQMWVSLYFFIVRSEIHPSTNLFDWGFRHTSNTAPWTEIFMEDYWMDSHEILNEHSWLFIFFALYNIGLHKEIQVLFPSSNTEHLHNI